MPTSIVAAVVGSVVADYVGAAVGAGILGSIIGGVAGFAASTVVTAAFADTEAPAPAAAAPASVDTYAQQPQQIEIQTQSRTLTFRQSASPWQIIYGQTRVGGCITYIRDTEDGWIHLVITMAGHACQELGDIYFNDDLVPLDGSGNATGTYAGYATIEKSLGTEAASVQPFPNLVTATGGDWGSTTHFQTGRAKLYVKLKYSRDIFPTAMPNISCVVKGKKVYDPRSGLTAWSANAALCINDYLCDSKIGLGLVYASEVNATQLTAAANTCDEAVSLAAGGTEARYTCNGAFDANVSPRNALSRLLTSMDGTLRFLGGQWGVYPAVYVTPTVTLTIDDARGPITVRPRLSRRDLANAVKGVYISPVNLYQPSDFPAVQSSTYYAEDQNEWIWRELDLPFTSSGSTAQRIAKIELLKTRQQISVTFPGKLNCYILKPGDTVMLTVARFGWTAKVFEVQAVQLVADGDPPVLGCDLTLRETASSVYDWSTSEEQAIDPAPDTNLPDPLANLTVTVGTPQSGTSQLFVAGDGTVHSKIALPISCTSPYLRNYEIQHARSGVSPTEWIPGMDIPAEDTVAYFLPVQDGVAYDLRVRAVSVLGNRGAWATVSGYTVVGKTQPPSAPTSFTVAQQGNIVLFIASTVDDTDLDLIEIRYGETTNDWANASPVGNILRGKEMTTASIPPGTWKFFARSKDTSGNYSTTEMTATATITSSYVDILTKEYAPAWTGYLYQLVRHWTGVVTLDSQSLASALDWEVFDQFVPNPCDSGYFTSPVLDKSVDAYARVWADIVTVLGPGETTGLAEGVFAFDYRLAAGSFDGYENWSIGVVDFRYGLCKLTLEAATGNMVCSAFTVTVDGVERVERGEGVAVGAGGTAITYSSPFHVTPNLQVTNVGTPARITGHSGNSTTGATLRTFDTTGAGAAGTVDWTATGA